MSSKDELLRPAGLEDCLKLVRQDGFRLLNLFQRIDGMWQANLYKHRHSHPQEFYEFAYAPSPADAVFGALVKARKGLATAPQPLSDDERQPDVMPLAAHVEDDEDLLG